MIHVVRSVVRAEPEATPRLLEALDSSHGAWLGCDVQAEGLYRRESMGCLDPALGFFLDGRELRVLAFTATGHVLLEYLRPFADFSTCPGGIVARFTSVDARQHPVIQVLRRFLALFSPAYPELALFGVFSFDYYRLAEGGALPDDGRRRMVLYFSERVLVAKSKDLEWVEFRFPELKAAAGFAPAALEPVIPAGEADDLAPGGHADAVSRGVERLRRGELFSLVLSQTFRRRATARPSAAFSALRAWNPYPAMFFLNLGGGERLFGASPDLQVRADAQWVESAPVCGTYRRGTDPVADADQALALLNSDKEDASLAACADSDRNDKAKVCEPGTIEVLSRRRVHFFSTIIHTIDHIRGRRSTSADGLDILLAHATPATVTGLPKPAAVAAISEIESSPRGWYAGAVVRLGSDGSVDALTVLRAARVVGDIAEVRTGGNLLVDSDPAKEEEETRLKAETLFRVLAGASPRPPLRAVVFERRFKVSFVDGGDTMRSLFAECLASVGADVASGDEGELVVLGDGPQIPQDRLLGEKRPLLAIGMSALALLAGQGAPTTLLAEPRFARRVKGNAKSGGFLAHCGPLELGLYSRQVIELKNLPSEWQPEIATDEGWVLAARSGSRPQVAILCRPDSIQSLKNDAGRRLVHASLNWLANWKPRSGL